MLDLMAIIHVVNISNNFNVLLFPLPTIYNFEEGEISCGYLKQKLSVSCSLLGGTPRYQCIIDGSKPALLTGLRLQDSTNVSQHRF